MSSPTNLLNHQTLNCTIRGKSSNSTVQYRNLKFAAIPGRWKDSTPVHTLQPDEDGIYNATSFGPSCPHKRGAQAWDLTLIGNATFPLEDGQGDKERMDEFECLTATVTVPKINEKKEKKKEWNESKKRLPVFVWIHGGGLSMGSNSWPQYDLQNFVARSVEIGKPCIAVAINYRVGILGFLASRELGSEGNFGFKDQVLGFRWVKRHIAGFGGDPENVTAAGESAGGISLSTILCAETGAEALFERVVVMSGEVTLRKPRGRVWHEELYHDQLKYLGLDGVRREERVKKLREWDAEGLCQKLPLAQHFCAVVDRHWFRDDVKLHMLGEGRKDVHSRSWLREGVVGDTMDDGTILKARILDNPSALSHLHDLCSQHLTPSETHSLLSAYNLTSSPSTHADKQKHKENLMHLASELRFYLPSLVVHKGWKTSNTSPQKASRYHFHITNPVEGSFKGLASHELDVAFLLQKYNDDVFDDKTRKLAQGVADHFIRFVNGDGWCREGEVIVFTNDGVKYLSEEEYDKRYRGGRGKVLESIGAEKLWRLAEGWQGVREEKEEYERAKL